VVVVVGGSGMAASAGADVGIRWGVFNREPLQGCAFTFWEWFFGAEEIVKRHLHGLWTDGYARLSVGVSLCMSLLCAKTCAVQAGCGVCIAT
jgi:hypothetical protein